MAFIFSTSHLPETLVRRPDHLEDEEEDDDVMQPMPRAGGVRAFSHLPVRDNPATSTGPLRADNPRGGIAPIPMSEPQDDPPPPEADSDHNPEDDTTLRDHADDRPWYMPRITAQDLPPQDHPEDAHAPSPKPWENTTRDSGFDDAPPADRSTSSTRDNGFSPSPQDLRDAFHSPTQDTPTGEVPAQNNNPALTRGRIFEKRLPPGFRGQGTGPFENPADKAVYHDLVFRPSSAQNERHQHEGFFQNVADTRATRQAPSSPKAPQTFAQSVRPAAQPAQKGGQTTAAVPPPAPGNGKDTPPTFKVDPADESKKGFMLKNPETQEKYPSDRAFGDHVRSIMQDEIDNSPTAKRLLEYVTKETGKPVIIQMSKDGKEAQPHTGPDGSLIITVNPTNLRSGTLSHEITHIIQSMALIKASQATASGTKTLADARREASNFLNGLIKVMYDGGSGGNGEQDGRGDGDNYQENEAMRAANIVNAELDALRIKEELEQLKKTDEKRYNEIVSNPARIAAKFWYERSKHENVGHQDNQRTQNQSKGIPIGTRYGNYDFEFVNQILGLEGKHRVQNSMPLR